jgi:hypothetical protein
MKKPILITGSHRSGSTWLGRIIGLSPEILYIQEPFNISIYPNSPLDYWFEYVSDSYPKEGQEDIKKYLSEFYNFNIIRLFKKSINAKHLYQIKSAFVYEYGCFVKRPLFKDPIALLSSEWFYKEFDADILVLVRHPAAFIASIKVKGWFFDFNNLLKQADLMRDYFSDYEAVMKIEQEKQDIISAGILLWSILYGYVLELQKRYMDNPNWTFLKHEDLSLNPVNVFKEIFKEKNIKFTDCVLQELELSSSSNEKELLRRNSKKNITSWKERLTTHEIEEIKEGTRPIWTKFYDDNDW